MKHWWMILTGENWSTGREKMSQCHFVYHKSHMDLPGIEHGYPPLEAGDWPPDTDFVEALITAVWNCMEFSKIQNQFSGKVLKRLYICGLSGISVFLMKINYCQSTLKMEAASCSETELITIVRSTDARAEARTNFPKPDFRNGARFPNMSHTCVSFLVVPLLACCTN